MALTSKVAGVLLLFLAVALPPGAAKETQDYTEELFLRHLPDGRLLAVFEFATSWLVPPLAFLRAERIHHYGFFPKSLAEVMGHYGVQELHLSLTMGKWRTRVWGYPPHPAPPGAEMWAWFLPDEAAATQWPGLVNAVSGLLCAHLNYITPTSTYQPLFSFRPQGPVFGNLSSSRLRYAAIPRENVCTENFTPWLKLLPCGASAGLATLFSALRLYNTELHSLGLHFAPFCESAGCEKIGVRLLQTLMVVLNPTLHKDSIEWSLQSLFSKSLTSSCPLASSSRLTVDSTTPFSDDVLVPPASSVEKVVVGGVERTWSVYDVRNVTETNRLQLSFKTKRNRFEGMPSPPELSVQRFLTGSGHEWGGLQTELTNSHPTSALKVLYLDMVPWFCRVHLHTLHISTASVLKRHYTPAKDRQRPHTLELLLSLPPLSTSTISLQFNRAFLKWTEHPPDAHHGFYINSGVVTAVLSECPNCSLTPSQLGKNSETVLRLHTEPLLISLPTPDFSMPYNVICFVCTVIAIGFGSIFNLTTRTLRPASETEKGLVAKLWARLRHGRTHKEKTS